VAFTDGAKEADAELAEPLFHFRNFGQKLPFNWSTISNMTRRPLRADTVEKSVFHNV
jgi:hypothetical protein